MTRMDHPRFDCLCVADMCVDLVLRGNVRPHFHQVEQLIDAYYLELGGSANIFAAQYAHLGGRAGVGAGSRARRRRGAALPAPAPGQGLLPR